MRAFGGRRGLRDRAALEAAAELVVEVNGYRLRAEDSDLEKVTLSVARGELSVEALAIWLRQRLEPAEE
ncbi:MAG: hypothetical protein ACHQM4_01640 [Thermoanaerobaculia bacterium]